MLRSDLYCWVRQEGKFLPSIEKKQHDWHQSFTALVVVVVGEIITTDFNGQSLQVEEQVQLKQKVSESIVDYYCKDFSPKALEIADTEQNELATSWQAWGIEIGLSFVALLTGILATIFKVGNYANVLSGSASAGKVVFVLLMIFVTIFSICLDYPQYFVLLVNSVIRGGNYFGYFTGVELSLAEARLERVHDQLTRAHTSFQEAKDAIQKALALSPAPDFQPQADKTANKMRFFYFQTLQAQDLVYQAALAEHKQAYKNLCKQFGVIKKSVGNEVKANTAKIDEVQAELGDKRGTLLHLLEGAKQPLQAQRLALINQRAHVIEDYERNQLQEQIVRLDSSGQVLERCIQVLSGQTNTTQAATKLKVEITENMSKDLKSIDQTQELTETVSMFESYQSSLEKLCAEQARQSCLSTLDCMLGESAPEASSVGQLDLDTVKQGFAVQNSLLSKESVDLFQSYKIVLVNNIALRKKVDTPEKLIQLLQGKVAPRR